MSTIGEKIYKLRSERGLTLEELAQKIGVGNDAGSRGRTDFGGRKTHDSKPNTAIIVNIMVNTGIKKEADRSLPLCKTPPMVRGNAHI